MKQLIEPVAVLVIASIGMPWWGWSGFFACLVGAMVVEVCIMFKGRK